VPLLAERTRSRAGGSTDLVFRAVAQESSEALGQSVILEHHPSAGIKHDP
jgi:tripartite-type tricarboxylate transporter receptor subunit TctC